MQFVSQTHAVALNCLSTSSQRCIALLFCAEEVIKKALSLAGEIFHGSGAETPSSALPNYFSADFRQTDKNSAAAAKFGGSGVYLHPVVESAIAAERRAAGAVASLAGVVTSDVDLKSSAA